MTSRSWFACTLAAGLALGACAGAQKKSPQEQLVDVRGEQRALFDKLYKAYGGSELAGTGTGVLGHAVGEADRGYFERQCFAIGRGERPISVSPKLQEYLARGEVSADCKKANELQMQVAELEKQVAAGH